MFVIEEELKKLPQKPGVYLMHDAQDNIIYVGKAIRLRSRVQSYFREKINATRMNNNFIILYQLYPVQYAVPAFFCSMNTRKPQCAELCD